MFKFDYKNIDLSDLKKKHQISCQANLAISNFSADKRISWSLEHLPSIHIMSSSFGIQSVVLLHLVVTQKPNIPVILIDTGYLFPKTYRFIDMLTKKLNLNLKVFRPEISPAWQEARYGKLWKKGINGINFYNNINKVKPLEEALTTLSVQTWFSGLRRCQSKSRRLLSFCSINKGIFKVLPILDWSNNKIYKYIKKNNLDPHPLEKDGYVSLGDVHTTKKYKYGMSEEETRFFGLKRECGLHEN